MVKYNPLINTDRKRVEIVRPQVINTTVQQSADKLLIDKLENDKIMIGKNNAVGCSQYTIQGLKDEIIKQIPVPLEAGANISIKDNKINTVKYNDADIRKLIADVSKQSKNTSNQLSDTISANILTQEKVNKDLSQQITELYDKNSGNLSVINQYTVDTDVFKTKTIENLQQYDSKIEDLYNIADDIKSHLESSNLELVQTIEKSVANIGKVFEAIDAEKAAEKAEIVEKIEANYAKCSQECTDVINQVETKMNAVRADMKSVESVVLAKVELVLDKKVQEINAIISEHEKKVNEATSKVNRNMTQVNKEIQTVKNANPNSVEFARIVKTLTDKMAKIEQVFKFKDLE